MITVRRNNREARNFGRISIELTGADVSKTIDFAGILAGFRILDVNVTVDEAFANVDNTISVGIEGTVDKFVAVTAVNAIKGIGFNNKQFTAANTTAIVADVIGTASATGKATVTVLYSKQPNSRQDY